MLIRRHEQSSNRRCLIACHRCMATRNCTDATNRVVPTS
ncbi:hypothetical protein FM112_06520 [Gulosibacter sp. 10]|nr:hypothetical protein FM112_06520 [Gulosibacter sp. 10]